MTLGQAEGFLLVENISLVANLIGDVLSRLGLSVLIGYNFAQALRESELGIFGIALVDMKLHGELAYPLVEKLEASASSFAVETSFERQALKAELPDVLVALKPLGVKTVEGIVDQLRDRSRMQSLSTGCGLAGVGRASSALAASCDA